jgi:beta-N-acetylhexosaminidase
MTWQAKGLEQVAGQVLIAGFAAREAPQSVLSLAHAGALGGVILFKRNLGTVTEVSALVRGLASAAPAEAPLLVSIDQEGGRVARLGDPVLSLPPMRTLGDLSDTELTRRAGRALGQQLGALGITCDFAPVLDVDSNPENPVIGDRSFGTDPKRVTEHGLAFAAGLSEAGIIGCGKHFPGHGDTHLDSHLALPHVSHGRDRLEAMELVPFRAACGRIPMLMTAHIVFEALDPQRPATLSPTVITELLRKDMGYDGVVVSDDLEMRAIRDHYGIPDAACQAIEAGCDAVLICSDVEALRDAHKALLERARRSSPFAEKLERAASRFVALRAKHAKTPILDNVALHAALACADAHAVERELSARGVR